MNLLSTFKAKLTTALLALALCATDATAMNWVRGCLGCRRKQPTVSTAMPTAAPTITSAAPTTLPSASPSFSSSSSSISTSSASTSSITSALNNASSSTYDASASASASSSSTSFPTTAIAHVNDGETKTIAPTTIDKQSAHRSQLNTLLYDKLDPMPPELIDIILDYECYEFKGKLAKTLTDHKGLVCSLIQLNDGRIASGSYDNTIKIWDPEFCKCVKTIEGNTNTFFNIIQLTNNHIAFYSNDSIKAWDPSTNECVRTLIKYPSAHSLLIQLSDGRIASDSYTNFIEIESAENSLSRQTLIGHAGWVQCLIQLINGRYKDHIASGSWDHTIKIWNTRTGACVATLKGHTDMVSCLIQLTNNLIASGSFDGTIKIWDLTTNSCIHTLNNSTGIRCLIQLTDGRLASGSYYTITIWDLTTNSCVNTLTGHMNGIFCLTQLADGRLVSGLRDGKIVIWK